MYLVFNLLVFIEVWMIEEVILGIPAAVIYKLPVVTCQLCKLSAKKFKFVVIF